MQCPNCGCENLKGMKFCGHCAAPLSLRCPQCGVSNPLCGEFCEVCGTSLGEQMLAPALSWTEQHHGAPDTVSTQTGSRPADRRGGKAERRQLTMMFCDLVSSAALAERLDPEELREVVRAYQEVCTEVIDRFGGYIARYVGDALLVYFGYPVAHDDDAARAVRAGVGIVGEMARVNARLQHTVRILREAPLQVRIGIHTGLVVVGELGGAGHRGSMALGETPNIAARVQDHAEPNAVLISAATSRLIEGLFECQALGAPQLKGVTTPLAIYRVLRESGVQSRFEVAVEHGLTPLVGREYEVGLLVERWERTKAGEGQVVLLGGEPGIGKSRLVQVVKERVAQEGALQIPCHCSPYHQNSAFYPIIEHLQRLLQFARDDPPHARGEKLTQTLARYHFPQADTVPLLAALLSLPQPEGSPLLTLSPQRQKQKTQEALVAWVVEEAEQHAVYCYWEDVHWADPSSLELLTLLINQAPTTRLYLLLTFRPEFTPPWGMRSHISQPTLSRLPRTQAEVMVERVMGGKALPHEVVQRIVAKTDGVPLFVEEVTKSVMESVGALREAPLQLGIPATLHDALMARLDRLNTAKEVAQLGATIGREFSYELLQALSPVDERRLRQALSQLVEAEVLYQRGLPPQVHYIFKHALIQEAAYQSLLKSKRQQLHRQIARVLEEQLLETREIQPELLAHHYTEAGLLEQAIPYWQQAGQRAAARSANIEATNYFTKGLDLLKALPDTPERIQQELTLQIALGALLQATTGYAAPEVERAYARARELCQQIGETPQLFPVLRGLWVFYLLRAELQTAHKLGQQLLIVAQRVHDPALFLEAHYALGATLFFLGELAPARAHLEQGISLYDLQRHGSHALLYGQDPGVFCRLVGALALWLLGSADQALERIHEALALAHELSHPNSQAAAWFFAAWLHQFRREGYATYERAEAVVALSHEQGFPFWKAWGTILGGCALVEQRQEDEGIARMRQGLTSLRTTGAELAQPYILAKLMEAHGKAGQAEEGSAVLTEALAAVHRTGECVFEAELYRLKGELTLQKGTRGWGPETSPSSTQASSLKSQVSGEVEREAAECFQKAIEIAQGQQAKSLELRAVMSLSRLWQQQGKKDKAWQLLAEIYGWFTEGFDTADLQEAKTLLEGLAS